MKEFGEIHRFSVVFEQGAIKLVKIWHSAPELRLNCNGPWPKLQFTQ